MGQLDQFAKLLFLEETHRATGGALVWDGAAELPLVEVRLDGLLRLLHPAALASLPAPWSLAQGASDIVPEFKMQGDHTGEAAWVLALLRRSAWAASLLKDRAEQAMGVALWVIGSHLPGWVQEKARVEVVAPGCYRVETGLGGGLWVAANELPLHPALIPFLVARSGKKLVEFARWVVGQRPAEWVTRMLEYVPMTPAEQNEILKYIQPTKDPERLKRRTHIMAELTRQMTEDDPAGVDEVLAMVSAERRLAGLAPEQRLAGLAPEQVGEALGHDGALLALPDDLLRLMPDEALATLSPAAREQVRKRIGR